MTLGGNVDGTDLTGHDVRSVYKFEVPDTFTNTGSSAQISPTYNDSDTDNSSDDPANYFQIESGETIQLDLKIDLTKYAVIPGVFNGIDPRESIESEINKDPSFTSKIDLVEMLDAITVQTDEAE